MDKDYLDILHVAKLLKVTPNNILNWIKEGKLKTNQEGEKYTISPLAYKEFTTSYMSEIMTEVTNNLWENSLKIAPTVQKEVSDRFKVNIQPVLNRAEQAVNILEKIHCKYEPSIDIFENKTGTVASFIIYAKIISLLYTIISLLKTSVFSESYILLRPLWEATLLAQYFTLSEINNENKRDIRYWFDKEKSPEAARVRFYLSKNLKEPEKTLETMKKLNNQYSKPIHHTYRSIMENYRGMSMQGFGKNYNKRNGFDYHLSTIMRDIITMIGVFEGLLLPSLSIFKFCFQNTLELQQTEIQELDSEISFYQLEELERLNLIFGNRC